MAWQDRPYYRDSGSSPRNPLLWLMSGSLPLFTAFGIRVRMHAMMLVVIALQLAFAGTRGGMGVQNAIAFAVLLFLIVLLHEFGHCFAARSVGGEANEILLWPLGGLAFADAPKRPWPQFVTVAGGPLVNVALCLLSAAVIAGFNRHHPLIPWNPLSKGFNIPYNNLVAYYLWWTFIISWSLLLFNLLPVYPLDGGRLLQALLWFRLGYYRASIIAFTTGIVGGALMVLYGLVLGFFSWRGGLLIAIGGSCLWTCYTMRAAMKAAGPWEFQDDAVDYSASLWGEPEPRKKKRRLSQRAVQRLRQQAQSEEAEQQRIDAILAKVSAHGMHRLTWLEKRVLRKATERQRKRESELSRNQ